MVEDIRLYLDNLMERKASDKYKRPKMYFNDDALAINISCAF
jgi:hypothetical protein